MIHHWYRLKQKKVEVGRWKNKEKKTTNRVKVKVFFIKKKLKLFRISELNKLPLQLEHNLFLIIEQIVYCITINWVQQIQGKLNVSSRILLIFKLLVFGN